MKYIIQGIAIGCVLVGIGGELIILKEHHISINKLNYITNATNDTDNARNALLTHKAVIEELIKSHNILNDRINKLGAVMTNSIESNKTNYIQNYNSTFDTK